MKIYKIPLLIVILFLLIAAFGHPERHAHWHRHAHLEGLPYIFYQFLRFLICGISAYFSYLCCEKKHYIWLLILVAVAIIFNPFFQFHFVLGTWQRLDFIVAITFIIFLIRFRKEA